MGERRGKGVQRSFLRQEETERNGFRLDERRDTDRRKQDVSMYDNPPYYLTAYGLACKRGFTGTLDEWLASLVGPPGPQGVGFVLLGSYATEAELRSAHPTGKAGDCYKVGTGEAETVFYWDPEEKDWESVRVMGPTGQAGKDGAPGPAGADGTSVTHRWSGTTLTVTSASGTSSADLQGPAGENGADGATGPAGTDGADGTTFTPAVSETGVLSWTNDGGLTNPEPVDIKGPPGEDGAAGTDGADGKSAYQIAVDSGFTGTETEWLASLKGADGTSFSILGRYSTLDELMAAHPTGSEGDAWAVGSATDNDIYLWNVDTAAWTNIGSLQGPPGPAGQDGADGGPGPAGADGANGATFTPSVSETGVLSFTNDGGLPNPEPVDIKGPPGEDGAPGQDGTPGTDGKTAYQYAVDGGYTGTEEEFQALMGSGPWLSMSGGTLTGTVYGPDFVAKSGNNKATLSSDTTSGYLALKGGGIEHHRRALLSGGTGGIFLSARPDAAAEPNENNTVILGGIKSPVLDYDAANKAYVDTHALTVASNAGAHNSIFRGKNLGTAVTAAQYAAISAGTFDDLFIGDYWVINGVNWRIAAFDYYLGTGSTALTTHHAVIVPDTNLDTQKMNDTNITTGGYVGSKMYTQNLATARTKVNAVFSGHVLTHQFYLSNAATNGKVTGSTAVNQDVVLMSERNVYGQTIMSSECANGTDSPGWITYDRTQFPLFALAPEFIQKQRSIYWLRDVVSASAFANVLTNGYSAWSYASYSCGVRPAFSIS